MLRLTDRPNPAALVLSASPSSVSRASVLAGCAMVALDDHDVQMRRVELSRLSPVALYDAVPSDRLDAAIASIRKSDVIVLIAPSAGTAYSGLLPAFLDRLPDGALLGKVIVPLITGGDPAPLAAFEGALRRRLEAMGATVALGDLFDASDDLEGSDAGRRIDARVDRAVAEGLLALGGPVIQADTPAPIQSALATLGTDRTAQPALMAC